LPEQIAKKLAAPGLKYAFGPGIFGQIGGIGQRTLIPAHGKAVDVKTQSPERGDFASDEAVRRAGIGVHQIADSQGGGSLSEMCGLSQRHFDNTLSESVAGLV